MSVHEYFENSDSGWSILNFLNVCKLEPFERKIECYTTSLKNIANKEEEEDCRRKKAQSLLDNYTKEPQTDRKTSRKWEKERSGKQLHINQPIFGIGTINGGTAGNINGFYATGSSKREREVPDLQSDDDFVMPIQPKRKKQLSLSRKSKESEESAKISKSSLPGATPGGISSSEVPTNSNNDGSRTPPPKPLEETRDITTPQKPKLCTRSFQYLSKHISVSINEQGLIMKGDQDVIILEIPDEIQRWLINVLISEKDRFISAIMASLNPEHKFQKMCRIILYDFFSMTSEGLMDRNIGERKYTVEQIVPLFKAIQSVYREYKFDWIEVQLECIKDMKLLFPNFDLTLNKADGVCMKASNNKEIVFIEVSGGPEATVEKHVWEDTEKLIREAMFGLVSLLRDYLDKNSTGAKNIRTYMVQVIGDRMTLSEIRLVGKHFYTVSQIKSAVIPFAFDDVEKFFEIFELLYILLRGLEGQKSELKKLALTKLIKDVPTIRDWIWVPESVAEWEAIGA